MDNIDVERIPTNKVHVQHDQDEIGPWDAWAAILQNISEEEAVSETEKNNAFDDVLEHCKKMDGSVSVEDQITKIWDMLKITNKEIDAMKDICNALEKALEAEFPDCKAFPFGSSASGLGFCNCDLDVYVELGYSSKDEAFNEKTGMWGVKFRTETTFKLLKKTARFKNAISVLNARIPIVKFRDKLTGINCDVNVVSCLGVRNTKYLAFCTELDNRVSPLVCVIKYFCKVQEIISSGPGDHMNSYTLVLMVIFFLQKRGILHPLEVLQQGVDSDEVNGWNFAFCRDFSKLPELRPNPSSLLNLLLQFFTFYVNFSYGDNIVCPLVGWTVKKCNLNQGTKDQLELDRPLVVQDPFELTRNVGHAVSRQRLKHMLAEFSRAVELLEDLKRRTIEVVRFWMLLEPGMIFYRDIVSRRFDDSMRQLQLDVKDEAREENHCDCQI